MARLAVKLTCSPLGNGRDGAYLQADRLNRKPAMPARVVFYLVLIAIVAGGLTVLAAQLAGLPMALLGLFVAGAALALRLWMMRQ